MLRVRGWSKFQHYKDRRPPWLKLHVELLANFKWHKLSSDSKALAICIWIVACEHDDPKSGLVTDDPEELAFRAQMDEKVVVQSIKQLIQQGFIEHIETDASDLLAPCYQLAAPEAEAEGETESETKKEDFSKNNFSYFAFSGLPFNGVVIQLDAESFNIWFQKFSFDGDEEKFRKIIQKRDNWYSTQGYNTQKTWMDKTTSWLMDNKRKYNHGK